MRKRAYPRAIVKVAPHPDPALAGKAMCPRPGSRDMWLTETPETVEMTPAIRRLISNGSLMLTDEEPVAYDPARQPFVERSAKQDFVDNFLSRK